MATTSLAAEVELVAVPAPSPERLDETVRAQLLELRELVETLRARPETKPGELAAAYGDLGRVYLAYGLEDAAAAALENAHRLAPASPEWLYLRGYADHQRGDFAAAAAAFRAQLELEPGDLAGRLRLAEALLRGGELAAAKGAFEEALERARAASASPGGGSGDGTGDGEAGDGDRDDPGAAAVGTEDGVDSGGAAAAAAAVAHWGLGRLAQLDGRFAAAAEHFETALAAQPDASAIRYPLALVYRELGRDDAARAELAARGQTPVRFPDPRVDAFGPLIQGAVAYLYQGSLARRLGQDESALRAYRQAVTMAPESVEAHRELALLLAELGDADDARGHFARVVELEPGNALARYNLGTLLMAGGDVAAAAEHLAAAVEAAPTLGEAWLNLAIARARGDDREAALEAVATAIELDPDDASARLVRAQILVRLGRVDDALAELRRTVELAPRTVPAYLRGARLLGRQGRDGEARAVLETGLAAVPESGELAHALARLLVTSPDPALRDGVRALGLARQVADALPTPVHLETLALALAETGQLDRAVETQERAVAAARQIGRGDLVSRLEARLERLKTGGRWRDG